MSIKIRKPSLALNLSTWMLPVAQWYLFIWTDIFHVFALVVVKREVIIFGTTKDCTETAK